MSLEQHQETSEAKPLRAIHAEFHGSDTQINMLQMLSARGFTLHGTSVANTKDENMYRATIVLKDANDHQFAQALAQMKKIVTVTRAAEIDITDVSQHIQVRIDAVTQEQRQKVRKLGGHLDENIFFVDVQERNARSVVRQVSATLAEGGKHAIGIERQTPKEQTGRQGAVTKVRIRVRDIGERLRKKIESMGGALGGPIKIHYRANPDLVDRFKDAINTLGMNAQEILIGAPSVSSTTLLDKRDEPLDSTLFNQ